MGALTVRAYSVVCAFATRVGAECAGASYSAQETADRRRCQCIGDLLDVVERNTALVAFDRTDIGAVKAALFSERFLRKMAFEPVLAHVVSKDT